MAKNSMSLLAIGLNHDSAPVTVRERVSFAPERLGGALRDLIDCDGVEEAAILSTCNRTDLYCGLSSGAVETVTDWFWRYHGFSDTRARRYLYTYSSESAVRHLMRVASGLDSMVLGEPQILGQVKGAYNVAVEHGAIGRVLGRLFQQTFSVAKRVRTDTAIGSSPVSVAFAAVSLSKQIFGDLSDYTGLLIGAGETIELTARHLHANSIGRLIVANRSYEGAHRIAAQFGGYAIGLDELSSHLGEADIVMSSTASEQPIVTLEQTRAAFRRRKHKPMFMVDIAVPRDIESTVGDLADVYLYTVDDLRGVVEENIRSRREAAHQAEEIIDTQVRHFMGWLDALDSIATIRAVRESAESARDEVQEKAHRMLRAGTPPDQVLDFLAHTLTNKLMHPPSATLRRVDPQLRPELLAAARVLFGLSSTARSDGEAHGPTQDEDPEQ